MTVTLDRYVIRESEDGLVSVRTRRCPGRTEVNGTAVRCDRDVDHLPSVWHRNRKAQVVWYG